MVNGLWGVKHCKIRGNKGYWGVFLDFSKNIAWIHKHDFRRLKNCQLKRFIDSFIHHIFFAQFNYESTVFLSRKLSRWPNVWEKLYPQDNFGSLWNFLNWNSPEIIQISRSFLWFVLLTQSKVTRSDDGQTLKNQSWNIIIQYSAVHCSGTILRDIKLIIIKMAIKQIICYFKQLISFAIF